MFGGIKAETAKQVSPGDIYSAANPNTNKTLREALDLEMAGKDRDEVFRGTGWYRLPDGNWSFNINDRPARLNLKNFDRYPGTGGGPTLYGLSAMQRLRGDVKVGDLYNNPELYAAYPHLKDIPVRVSPHFGPREASYNHNNNTLTIGTGTTADDLMDSFGHELGHSVQFYEGWARGGAPMEFRRPNFGQIAGQVTQSRNTMEQAFRDAGIEPLHVRQIHGFGEFMRPTDLPGVDPTYVNFIKGLDPATIGPYRDLINFYKELGMEQIKSNQSYLNLAGEVQSRAIEAQRATKRYDQPLWEIPDVVAYDWATKKPVLGSPVPYERQIIFPFDRPITAGGGLQPWSPKPNP
jgi:hypothetical protein